MSLDVLLPQWGMGMNDGLVIKWLKKEGETVTKGEPLVEIESSKVNGEVESPGDGTLARIVVPEGMVADVGAMLAVILVEGETADLPDPVGQSKTQQAVGVSTAESLSVDTPVRSTVTPGKKTQVTPIARRLARELGIDVSTVNGTGPGGRVTEQDVRSASETPSPTSKSDSSLALGRTIKISGLRAAVARRMSESSAIPQVTLTTEIDVSNTMELMNNVLRDWRTHRIRPQFQDFVLKAVVRTLTEYPRANSHLVGDEIKEISDVNLGFALAVTDGLLVPVIHKAQSKSLLEIAQDVRSVAKRVREGKQTVEDLSSSTFTVTGLGSFNVDTFNPLLNPPEVGILGFGRVVQKPVVVSGNITIRSMLWVGLTFDHRAWDGAPAGEFLQTVSSHLSNPGWMND